MRLRPFDQINPTDTPYILNDYRDFVGPKAAFHIECVWAAGKFYDKDREASFMLDNDSPTPYEELEKLYEKATWDLAGLEVQTIDLRRDKKMLTVICFALAAGLAYSLL